MDKFSADEFQLPHQSRVNYLQRRRADVESIKSNLDQHSMNQQSYDAIVTIGHQVKGNAASFDFNKLTPLASELEKAAQAKDRDQILLVLLEFQKTVNGYLQEVN